MKKLKKVLDLLKKIWYNQDVIKKGKWYNMTPLERKKARAKDELRKKARKDERLGLAKKQTTKKKRK